jgi:hypothetical protein
MSALGTLNPFLHNAKFAICKTHYGILRFLWYTMVDSGGALWAMVYPMVYTVDICIHSTDQ